MHAFATFTVVAAGVTIVCCAMRRHRSTQRLWRKHHSLRDGTQCVIRSAVTSDVATIYKLVHDLAVVCGDGHEMLVDLPAITAAFEARAFEALVATLDEAVVGMAILQQSFRTFTGTAMYLQDLIVNEDYRGTGIGTLLFQESAAFALSRGSNRLFWESVIGNDHANAFYAGNTIGAEQVTCHLHWRIEGRAALEACARHTADSQARASQLEG